MGNKESGFTLVEMLIVLLIISILILLIVPHVSKKSANINDKGCDALVELVKSQVVAYELDKKKKPQDLQELVTSKYIDNEHLHCGNGKEIVMGGDGEISHQ